LPFEDKEVVLRGIIPELQDDRRRGGKGGKGGSEEVVERS